MGAVNAAKPEPQPVAETPISQCRGPGSIPSQGTRFHMPQLQIVRPLGRPGQATSTRKGEGSRNMGEAGVTPGRAAQASMAVVWMRWEPSDRLAAPDPWGQGGQGFGTEDPGPSLRTPRVSNCGLTEALMPGKSPLNPGRTPWGSRRFSNPSPLSSSCLCPSSCLLP